MSWGLMKSGARNRTLKVLRRTLVALLTWFVVARPEIALAGAIVVPMIEPPAELPRVHRPFEIDRAEFEAFLDGFVQSKMQEQHIPGVVFYMVKDGKVFLAKGYGYADLEKKTPMDPNETVLSVGSLTKLFTATACMQLVEQGKLDLFADVNEILTAFHVPETFAEPITLAHLLEHTDGLDVAHIGIAARTEADVVPFESYLAGHLPPRVRSPGLSAVYGEHGMALAGYLVQIASGEPFEQYMHRHLLEPLHMDRSDFRIRPDMSSNVCVGYVSAHGEHQPVQPAFAYHVTPAAGLMTTAADVGRFMLAHLNEGSYGDARILESTTANLMLRQKFGLHPMLSAWSYGFHSRYHGEEFCIEHGGMSLRTVSQLCMMPDHDIGFLIAGNSLSMQLHKQFHHAFLKRYFGPGTGAGFNPDAAGVIDARKFEGTYAALHRSITTLERLNSMTHQTKVIVTSPTTLRTESSFDTVEWTRIAPAVYESPDDEARIAFVFDGQHNVYSMLNGPHECVKLAWWETVFFHKLIFAALGLVFASGMLAPFVAAIMRRRRGEAAKPMLRERVRTLLFFSLCSVNAFFIVGLAETFRRTNALDYIFGLPRSMELVLILPIMAVALTPAVIGFVLSSWVDRDGSFLRRVYDTIVAAACMVFLLIATHWNLIGFNVA